MSFAVCQIGHKLLEGGGWPPIGGDWYQTGNCHQLVEGEQTIGVSSPAAGAVVVLAGGDGGGEI